MIGLYLLGLFVLYVWLWWLIGRWITRRMQGTLAKISVSLGIALLASVVLLGDEITGRYQFETLCKSEGGYKYYKQVPKPNGLAFGVMSPKVAVERLKKYDLKYVEEIDPFYEKEGRNVTRYSLTEDGDIKQVKDSMALASYQLKMEQSMIGKNVQRIDFVIRDIKHTEPIVAGYFHFIYLGGWAARTFVPRHISGECPRNHEYLNAEGNLLKAVFGIGK